MKERPILLNAEMVRAVLDGRKTQTRRMVANIDLDNCLALRKPTKTRNGIYTHVMDAPTHGVCPFGAVGDRLWVRETFAPGLCTATTIAYRATHKPEDLEEGWYERIKWTPSIHMPRWASRITLEITGVRVERLNSISEIGAMREGIQNLTTFSHVDFGIPGVVNAQNPVRAFQLLWQGIYGEESWQANPWVWVIEFKRVEGEA